jgi:hypothetical protein
MTMRVRNPLSHRRSHAPGARRTRAGDGHTRTAPDAAPEEPAEPLGSASTESLEDRRERLVRESGGPQDQAHYACSCGYQFTANVGTDVICPHCGSEQAW